MKYKKDRNYEILEEYEKGNTSYNKLSRKYDLTAQRIQIICKEAKIKKNEQLKKNI